MGYTMTLELDSVELATKIKGALLESEIHEYAQHISTDPSNHGYAPDHVKIGVAVSYSILDSIIHRYLWNIMSYLANKYKGKVYYDDELLEPQDLSVKWVTMNHHSADNVENNFVMRMFFKRLAKKDDKQFEPLKEEFKKKFKLI